MRRFTVKRLIVLLVAGAFWQAYGPRLSAQPHGLNGAHMAEEIPSTSVGAPQDRALPPSEATAKAALEKSPRHFEWADVKLPGSAQTVKTFVVYPERKDKAPVVIVIHEIFGLSDWIRGVADALAREGFIAVAPDLISGKGPGGGNTDSLASRDDVVKLVMGLKREEVVERLNAVRDYAVKLSAATGNSATVGFCWGGSTSFMYATVQPGLNAAVVYYGTAPDPAALALIKAPVLGLYGGDDARVTSTVEPTAAEMKKAGKMYETEIYPGAGHGFLRQQEGRDDANLSATEKAWPRTLAFLRQHTR
jgi:carboxymethylenebutenolidase